MKVYARQVAPEFQESPFDHGDDLFEDIVLTGNRTYRSRTTSEYDLLDNMDYAYDQLKKLDCDLSTLSDTSCYASIEELCDDLFPRRNKKPYTENESPLWREIIEEWDCKKYRCDHDEAICSALMLMTGNRHKCRTIVGCCQGDYQWKVWVYYPEKLYTDKDIDILESYYFNLGSEWLVDNEGNFNPESDDPDDITGFGCYCTSWNEDDIRKEIANCAGCAPEDVVMYKIKSWKRTATYEEVS